MEDATKMVSNFLDSPGSAYYGVFDGHAGSFAAKWCAANFYKLLGQNLTLFSNQWSVPAIMAATFELVDKRLSATQGADESGCTAAVVYIKTEIQESRRRRRHSFASAAAAAALAVNQTPLNDSKRLKRTLYTANVGDSRIVLSSNGVARRLTYDHRASDPAETARIRQMGGIVTAGRVNGCLAVSRALGDRQLKPHVSSRPYTTSLPLDNDADEFLIIACDGIWDVIKDQKAVDLIRHIEDPAEAAQELVRQALFNGSTDNATCVIVRLKPSSAQTSKSAFTPTPETVVDTIDLQSSAVPLQPQQQISGGASFGAAKDSGRSQYQYTNMPPSSPSESDGTLSEEDDSLEDLPLREINTELPRQRPDLTFLRKTGGQGDATRNRRRRNVIQVHATPPIVPFHVRSTSFSPKVLERPQREKAPNTEESTLDRYGRFKRVVQMEFDYDGDDDCAIADDSE